MCDKNTEQKLYWSVVGEGWGINGHLMSPDLNYLDLEDDLDLFDLGLQDNINLLLCFFENGEVESSLELLDVE